MECHHRRIKIMDILKTEDIIQRRKLSEITPEINLWNRTIPDIICRGCPRRVSGGEVLNQTPNPFREGEGDET